MDTPVCYTHLPTPVMPKLPPQKLLLGQKALVTGASSGIGRAIALALGEAGADVVVNYVSGEDKAQALVEEIAAKGSSAVADAPWPMFRHDLLHTGKASTQTAARPLLALLRLDDKSEGML